VSNPIQSSEVGDLTLDRPAGSRDGAVASPERRPLRSHPYRQPFDWWLKRRGYLLYVIRELTALPIAVWWLLFLVEVARLRDGAGGYRPLEGWFVVVSLLCLAAALWHSFTFLNLAGLIMRIPLGDRNVPARTIVGAAFSGFAVVTALVAALLIWGGA
jgi:fumarate reductase subunit C